MAMIRKLMPIVLILMVVSLAATSGILWFAIRRAAATNGPALASRTSVRFRIDASFTASERALILEAFRKIKAVSGCVSPEALFDDVGWSELFSWRLDSRATIHRASNPMSWTYHMARYLAGQGSYMGIALVTTGDIFIMTTGREDRAAFMNTIIHETLHVVFWSGWHSMRKESLMYDTIDGSQHLLSEEVAMLRAMCAHPKTERASQ